MELLRLFEVAVAAGLKVPLEWPPGQSSHLHVVGQAYRDYAFPKENCISPNLYIPCHRRFISSKIGRD